MGPIIQQFQTKCDVCQAKGFIIDPAKVCKTCQGARTTSERKVLEVYVERGMKHGSKIRFPGEADQKVRRSDSAYTHTHTHTHTQKKEIQDLV